MDVGLQTPVRCSTCRIANHNCGFAVFVYGVGRRTPTKRVSRMTDIGNRLCDPCWQRYVSS